MAARAARVVASVVLLAASACVAGDGRSSAPRVPAAQPAQRPRVMAEFDGLENVRFGAPVEAVYDEFVDSLGRPDEDSGWIDALSPFGSCPGTQVRGVRWQRLRVMFSDGPTDAAGRGTRHFFSYDALEALDPRPLDVRTEAGIGLGATLREVRAVYGADVHISASDPPFVRIDGSGGRTLRLDLTSRSEDARVQSIRAGAPACTQDAVIGRGGHASAPGTSRRV